MRKVLMIALAAAFIWLIVTPGIVTAECIHKQHKRNFDLDGYGGVGFGECVNGPELELKEGDEIRVEWSADDVLEYAIWPDDDCENLLAHQHSAYPERTESYDYEVYVDGKYTIMIVNPNLYTVHVNSYSIEVHRPSESSSWEIIGSGIDQMSKYALSTKLASRDS